MMFFDEAGKHAVKSVNVLVEIACIKLLAAALVNCRMQHLLSSSAMYN